MEPILILYIGGGLGLLLLAIGGAMSLLGQQTVVEERLGRYADSAAAGGPQAEEGGESEQRASPVADLLSQLGEGTELFEGISTNLAQADMKLRPPEYLALIVLVAIGSAVIGLVLSGGSLLFAVPAGIGGAFLPGFYVGWQKRARLKKFDHQLGDMINLMVNGLRAGFSTMQAMEAVSRELPPPISVEFHRVVQEMQLGISMEEALDHMLRRINSDDLDMVITAINVQREVGGNLAEIMDSISYTIRERVRIRGEISALTAQGRATAWVISMLPLALVAILFLVNREYIMAPFETVPICGYIMFGTAGLMIIVGFFITQKIVDIDI